MDSYAFSRPLPGLVFQKSRDAAGFLFGIENRFVALELNILSSSRDLSGNIVIATDAHNSAKLKLLFSPSLSALFTVVVGVANQSAGRLTVPATSPALQGAANFLRVVRE